jgi:hypothetical protein
VPRTRFANLSEPVAEATGLPGFYVRGGRRTRYGATQHISVVLTARAAVSRAKVPVANWRTAVTVVAAR